MDERTTAAVQRYLLELKGDTPSDQVVRELVGRAANRLHLLCSSLLVQQYPRLMRPPLNLQSEEMLSSVVERLLKAMRDFRPENTRQFFGMATRHMRWELNDLARRLDEQTRALELRDELVASPASNGSVLGPRAHRMLDAIDELPEEEREVFDLIRIQGMTHKEAAELLGVSTKTVQRRLNGGVLLLTEKLSDLRPAIPSPGA